MSGPTTVVFNRSGGIELRIDRSEADRFYATAMIARKRKGKWSVETVASVNSVRPAEVTLVKFEDWEHWTLQVGATRFRLSEKEAHRMKAAFPELRTELYPSSKLEAVS
jgi:hypothetical protein